MNTGKDQHLILIGKQGFLQPKSKGEKMNEIQRVEKARENYRRYGSVDTPHMDLKQIAKRATVTLPDWNMTVADAILGGGFIRNIELNDSFDNDTIRGKMCCHENVCLRLNEGVKE